MRGRVPYTCHATYTRVLCCRSSWRTLGWRAQCRSSTPPTARTPSSPTTWPRAGTVRRRSCSAPPSTRLAWTCGPAVRACARAGRGGGWQGKGTNSMQRSAAPRQPRGSVGQPAPPPTGLHVCMCMRAARMHAQAEQGRQADSVAWAGGRRLALAHTRTLLWAQPPVGSLPVPVPSPLPVPSPPTRPCLRLHLQAASSASCCSASPSSPAPVR
jgi:hypothetical protein